LTNTEVWMLAKTKKDDYPVIEDLMDMALMSSGTSQRDYQNAIDLLREALEDIEDDES